MSTLRLVAPEARDLIAQMPPIDLRAETLGRFRADVIAIYPTEPVSREERFIPGPVDALDVRVLILPAGDSRCTAASDPLRSRRRLCRRYARHDGRRQSPARAR